MSDDKGISTLEVEHLTKRYHVRGKGDFLALDDVNFTLTSGEIIGLVGQSGSGKSTIAKILTTGDRYIWRGAARRQADTDPRQGFEKLPPDIAHGVPGSVRVFEPLPYDSSSS